jgi:hypothetical protein
MLRLPSWTGRTYISNATMSSSPPVLVFTGPAFRWLPVDSQIVAVSSSFRLRLGLTRAPPVR